MLKNLDVCEIKKYIPLAHPSLLLDYVEEVEEGKWANGYKNFTYSEAYFAGHFPNDPNVPSGTMIDALSQIMLMCFLTMPGNEGKETGCLQIKKALFKKKVKPGDRLDLSARLSSCRHGIAVGSAEGKVGGAVVCSAEFVIGILDDIRRFRPKKENV